MSTGPRTASCLPTCRSRQITSAPCGLADLAAVTCTIRQTSDAGCGLSTSAGRGSHRMPALPQPVVDVRSEPSATGGTRTRPNGSSRRAPPPISATGMLYPAFLGDPDFITWIHDWLPLIFMGALVVLVGMTMRLMPADQAGRDQARVDAADRLGRHRRRRRGQGRAAARSSSSCATPSGSSGLGAQRPAGHPAARAARHRQDAAGQGRGPRVGRALLRPVGVVVRRDVRRPRRGAHPPPVPRGAQARAGDHLHRRARRRRRARRGTDINGEHDQTLNQLLVEMDGFASHGRTSS